MNYRELLEKVKETYSSKTAIEQVGDDNNIESYSYERMVNDVRKAASYLLVNKYSDKCVGIVGKNSYQWLVCAYGCFYSGTTVIFFNQNMSINTIKELSDRVNLSLMITDDEMTGKIKEAGISYIEMGEVLKTDDVIDEYKINTDINKPACMMCSSGTTGLEKIILLSQKNILTPLARRWANSKNNMEKQERIFWSLPFFHTGILSVICMFAMDANILCINRSPKYFFKELKLFKPDMICCVPMHMDVIIKKMASGKKFIDIVGENCKCISSGAAKISGDSIKKIVDEGVCFFQGYGLTESSSMGSNILVTAKNQDKRYSVGKPACNVEIVIKDGEIVMRGDCIMMGYYGDEALSREVLRNGWLYTGDLGYFDEDGYLYITGRKKNLIITSNGENVSPEEIENYFISNDKIAEIYVYEEKGNIVAEIYTKNINNREKIDADIEEYNKNTPPYKNIRIIRYRDTEFDKTATGKIKRYK